MEVGLGSGYIVLDRDPLTPKGHSPQFSTRLLGPNGWWIKMPLGTEVDLGPGHVLDGPSSLRKGAQQLPSVRPMSTVAIRSPISATAELL